MNGEHNQPILRSLPIRTPGPRNRTRLSRNVTFLTEGILSLLEGGSYLCDTHVALLAGTHEVGF